MKIATQLRMTSTVKLHSYFSTYWVCVFLKYKTPWLVFQNCGMALKFDKRLNNSAAESQNNLANLNTKLRRYLTIKRLLTYIYIYTYMQEDVWLQDIAAILHIYHIYIYCGDILQLNVFLHIYTYLYICIYIYSHSLPKCFPTIWFRFVRFVSDW